MDRTHGKQTRKLLNRVEIKVIHHNDLYAQDTKDTVWIKKCGEEKWVVLTGDKEIERVPENRQAVIDAKCKVLFFDDTNSIGEVWAAAVIVGRDRIFEIIERNNGPLFVTIEKQAKSHISKIRFVADGGPKPAEVAAPSEANAAVAAPSSPPKPARKPQQKEIEFP